MAYKMSLNNLSLKQKTLFQIGIAITISLVFQFLIPVSWRPLPTVIGEDFESWNVIFTLSQWFFSFSIAWFFFRDNRYINNYLICSILPLGVIVALEFTVLFLYYDYLHLLPFIIDMYILWKKRGIINRKLMLSFLVFFSIWFLLDYFLGLAYYQIPLFLFLLALLLWVLVMFGFSFFFKRPAEAKKGILRQIVKGIFIGFWIFSAFLGTILVYWYIRPNTAAVNQSLVLESWVAVTGKHNSNTDLIYWNNSFYLVNDNRPYHLGSAEAKLIVWRSLDAHNWIKIKEFSVPGEDIRDPKFAAIGNFLFMYALKNKGIMADPYQTVFTYIENGSDWQPFQEISQKGWLFWRPETNNNVTWYVPAYWHEHGKATLLNSTNGINWTIVSYIYVSEAIDETAIKFLPDGRMICTGRLEGSSSDNMFGSSNASTLIAVSSYPYTNWSNYTKSTLTRLDGPALFSYENKTYAIGRYQPGLRTIFTELGSVFSKKRTAIFELKEEGLIYLSDLPSAGDTSYAGVVVRGKDLYISYYTSDINRDFPWVLGMVANSDIRMARINLTALGIISN